MREILFRAWDNINKKYWDVQELMFNTDLEVEAIRMLNWRQYTQSTLYDFVLEQFTGLTDKNGVKIFEGDHYQYQNGEIYTIYFVNGSFCGGLREDYCSPLGWKSEDALEEGDSPDVIESFFHKEIEVIGNIHEGDHK